MEQETIIQKTNPQENIKVENPNLEELETQETETKSEPEEQESKEPTKRGRKKKSDKKTAEEKEEQENQETDTENKLRQTAEDKKTEFFEAMANVYKEIPKISTNKTARATNGDEYTYADLNSVIEETRPILAKNNLFIEFRQNLSVKKGILKVYLLVHHRNGYSYKSETMKVPVNVDNIQRIASALTYIKRYLFSSMFTTCSIENDDDGKNAINIKTEQVRQVNNVNPHSQPKNNQNQQNNQKPIPKKPIPPTFTENNKNNVKCSVCGKEMSGKELSFSMNSFGKPICFPCQQKGKQQ